MLYRDHIHELQSGPRRYTLSKAEVTAFLAAIDAGTVTLTRLNAGNNVHLNYEASNGWKLTVFNDAGCFDYIDYVESADGGASCYYDLYDEPDPLVYDPPLQTLRAFCILPYWDHDDSFVAPSELYQNDGFDDVEPSQVITIDEQVKAYFARHPDRLYQLSPRRFEELIADILRDLGFECDLTPATRDGGCDIYAHIRNRVTAFLLFVECKRYKPERKVGIEVVQRVHGAVEAAGAHKGMIVTTSFFSQPAINEQRRIATRMELADFEVLGNWLKRYR